MGSDSSCCDYLLALVGEYIAQFFFCRNFGKGSCVEICFIVAHRLERLQFSSFNNWQRYGLKETTFSYESYNAKIQTNCLSQRRLNFV